MSCLAGAVPGKEWGQKLATRQAERHRKRNGARRTSKALPPGESILKERRILVSLSIPFSARTP